MASSDTVSDPHLDTGRNHLHGDGGQQQSDYLRRELNAIVTKQPTQPACETHGQIDDHKDRC
jgi:hypothetical protein